MEHLLIIAFKIIGTCILAYHVFTTETDEAWKEIGYVLFVFIIGFLIYALWNI
jgi:hypothetical protein